MADDEYTTKQCGKCQQTLPREAFTADLKTPTGLKCYCRRCSTLDSNSRRALKPKTERKSRRKKPVPIRDAKPCSKCQQTKALAEFGPSKQTPDGLKRWCRECHNAGNRAHWDALSDEQKAAHTARGRDWNDDNPGKATLYHGRWRTKNPAANRATNHAWRARRRNAGGHYTAADVERIIAAQKGKCAYCSKPISKNHSIDHIVPLAKGGSNYPRNIQITCRSCNSKKHATDPIDFAQQLGRLL